LKHESLQKVPAQSSSFELSRIVLVVSVLATAALYSIPAGHVVGYPLLLLSTLAHEMGHGIAAWVVGGHFVAFELNADASGVAHTAVSGRFAHAAVSAGGLVGPSFAALACFIMGKRRNTARLALALAALVMSLTLVLVVRNVFGWAFISILAAASALIAWKGGARLSQLVLVFTGTQLALSVYSRGDYLFTPVAQMASGPMPSDVAQISEALFLPYWFWGALCGSISVVVLIAAMVLYWRAPKN
jgi:Peptidase M50B-like